MKIYCHILLKILFLTGTFALFYMPSAFAADLKSINALKNLENQKWKHSFSFDRSPMEDVGIGGGGTGTGSGGGTGTGGGGTKGRSIVWDPNGDWRWNDDGKSMLNGKNWLHEDLSQ